MTELGNGGRVRAQGEKGPLGAINFNHIRKPVLRAQGLVRVAQ